MRQKANEILARYPSVSAEEMAQLSVTLAPEIEDDASSARLFYTHVHLHGGPAPVRRYLPTLIELVLNDRMNSGKVFDLELPLEQVAEGYEAMDERPAIKALLRT